LQHPILFAIDLSTSKAEAELTDGDYKTEDEESAALSPVRKHASKSTVTVLSSFEEGSGLNIIDGTVIVSTFEAELGQQENDEGAAMSSCFQAEMQNNAIDGGSIAPRSPEIEPGQGANNDTSIVDSPVEVDAEHKETDDLACKGEAEQHGISELQATVSYDASIVESYVEAEPGQNDSIPAISSDDKSIDVSYRKVERGQEPNTESVAILDVKTEQPTDETSFVGSSFEREIRTEVK
jgi:hypothetical protein